MSPIAAALAVLMLVGGTVLGGCGDETRRAQWPQLRPSAGEREALRPAATPPKGPIRPDVGLRPNARLEPGRFLVATRRLEGPYFARTVVLLLDYSETGALGLIVNRPTDVDLRELLPALGQLTDRSDRVFLGGPVDTQMMVFLIRSDRRPADSQHVLGDIHATGSADALRSVIDEDAPSSRFHAYVGYAGWGPGQLDAEVAQGDWYVTPAEPDQIFDPSLGDLWDRLVFEHEGTRVRAPLRAPDAEPLGGAT